MECAGQDEKGQPVVPFRQESVGHLPVAQTPVDGRRLGIEPVVGDDLVEATVATELLEEPEGPGGKAAVPAEELCRARQRPEAIEVELTAVQEVLHRLVYLLERPLERDGPDIELLGERVQHARGLVNAVLLSDDKEPRIGDGRPRSSEDVVVEADVRERIARDGAGELRWRPDDHVGRHRGMWDSRSGGPGRSTEATTQPRGR